MQGSAHCAAQDAPKNQKHEALLKFCRNILSSSGLVSLDDRIFLQNPRSPNRAKATKNNKNKHRTPKTRDTATRKTAPRAKTGPTPHPADGDKAPTEHNEASQAKRSQRKQKGTHKRRGNTTKEEKTEKAKNAQAAKICVFGSHFRNFGYLFLVGARIVTRQFKRATILDYASLFLKIEKEKLCQPPRFSG